jgi:glycosyltransferase involved in cell wall biosynthesis
MPSEPLVSIVTPFYNTAQFLGQCIESVLGQTYTNWEYILVNNCSSDGSEQIVQEYVSRFPDRIRLTHTPSFLSQLQNYNLALSYISAGSKYCKVVQADDWIFPDCIRRMVEVGELEPSVAIIAAYELEGNVVALDGLPYPATKVLGRDVARLFFLDRYYLFGTPTSLLMRAELVRSRSPFYDERLAPFADAHACFALLKYSNFGFVHQVLTFSRRDNDSILLRMRPFSPLRFARLAFVVVHGKDYLSEKEYKQCLEEAEYRYFLVLGKALLRGESQEFWQFHRAVLASIGYSFEGWRKWDAVRSALCDYLGNPKRAWDAFHARRRRAHGAIQAVAADRW